MRLDDEPRAVLGDRPADVAGRPDRVDEIEFTWRLAERGTGTRITVDVAIAPATAHQLDRTRELIAASLPALAALAEAG